ncbi:MAG: glycosyltransferase family 4 protein [Chloroflexi bacterium]|nr:glycosyltransferase family 4 protein [Chloroflexota bacterium]
MQVVFIIPRYGPDILGGAEALARGFAERLAQQGWVTEVWTTCARDYYTWKNVYPAGVETSNGVIVRRFPALMNHRPDDGTIAQKAFGNFPTTPEAQYRWLDEGLHSPCLYHYLFEHGANFDYLIFLPYSLGFTCYSASIFPERSVIWPCLHPDPTAYFEPVQVMLHRARGIIANSQAEEKLLTHGLGVKNPRCQVLGYGLEAASGETRRFYERYPDLKTPFMLYAGRLEKAKNTHLLIDYFLNYTEISSHGFNLVLIGSGPVAVPHHPRLFQLGYLSEQAKYDAYAAATVLCQPSVYESFGITLMEAWLHETPVLVHGECPVTLEHCLTAQGGLYFRDKLEFAGALDFLLTQPEAATQLGRNGRAYVEANYNWAGLIKKLSDTLAAWRVC